MIHFANSWANMSSNIDLNSNETQYLLSDISAAVQKIQQDHEHINGLANTPKSLTLASKTAQIHTKNLLPSLTEMILEMSKIHQAEMQRKVRSKCKLQGDKSNTIYRIVFLSFVCSIFKASHRLNNSCTAI